MLITLTSIFRKINKKPLVSLSAIWIIVQFSIFMLNGINTDNEAIRYIQNGTKILAEHRIIAGHLFYSFYSLLIAINLFFTKSFIPIVILQLGLNALATISFYKVAKSLTTKNIALLVSIILIIFYPIQQWNFYLYTESIFISEIIILLYLFLNLDFNKRISFVYVSSLFIVTFFTRPSGVYLSIPVLAFVILNYKLLLKNKILSSLFIIIILVLISKSYLYNSHSLNQLTNKAIHKSWIIYGYDKIGISSNPDDRFKYISEIVFKRFIYYFGMIRPYFGRIHNITLVLFYPIYLFAIFGIIAKTNSKRKIKLIILLIIAAFTTGSILTFINWHGRFIAPIIPLILILAAIGIDKTKKRFNPY